MWVRLMPLGVVTVMAAGLLLAPVFKMSVRLDFPAEAVPANAETISRSVEWTAKAALVICAAIILWVGGAQAPDHSEASAATALTASGLSAIAARS